MIEVLKILKSGSILPYFLLEYLIGIFYPKILGDSCIKTQVKMYNNAKEQFPDRDPHYHLAQVFISRMKAAGEKDIDQNLEAIALSETYLCACIPFPQCARALGLYIIKKERPDIMDKYKIFQEEYGSLMSPVIDAIEKGTIDDLYRHYNPNMTD
jgi:hypothetical protein